MTWHAAPIHPHRHLKARQWSVLYPTICIPPSCKKNGRRGESVRERQTFIGGGGGGWGITELRFEHLSSRRFESEFFPLLPVTSAPLLSSPSTLTSSSSAVSRATTSRLASSRGAGLEKKEEKEKNDRAGVCSPRPLKSIQRWQ